MRRIFSYLRPYRLRILLGMTVKFVGTIMDLLLPWILAFIIDDLVPTLQETQNNRPLYLWGGVMLLCSAVALIGNIVANRMASRVARDTTERLRHDLFSRVVGLSCRQTDTFTIPSLESRLTSDTYNIHQMIGMMQRLGIRAPILLIGGVMVTWALEPVLTLVLLSVLPLIGFTVYSISRKGVPLYTELQRSIDRMVRKVRENASGIRVIKALSKADYEKASFDQINQDVVEKETKAAATMAASNPLMNLFLNLGLTLVVVVGAFRVNSGLTKPGTIIAFLSYFTIILNAMLSITRMFVMYSKGSASAGRICEVLDTPEDFTVYPKTVDKEDREKHIEFDHVSFSYGGRRETLHDIHFSLRRGETLGIMGATGSGKSTLLRLLLRFYDSNAGIIRIDGRDIRSIPFEELYTKFGVAFQYDFLFADSVAENVRFGRSISDQDLTAAASDAQAAPFIDELKDGYAHRLTAKGTNLSGGQKQRLLIARALAGNPEILLLDDSSSALDYATDARLRQAIRARGSNVTTILVAQRVSSIRHADHILVLEKGHMLGYGTHEELMCSCDSYREIARSQMGAGGENIA